MLGTGRNFLLGTISSSNIHVLRGIIQPALLLLRAGQVRSGQGRAGQDMTVPSLRRLCCCICTHRAFVARESGVVKHAERTRVVDSAASVTVDVLEKRTHSVDKGREGERGCGH